jgi:predicted secreted protein
MNKLPIFLILFSTLFLPSLAHSYEQPRPEDIVSFSISTEGWVTTQSARVTMGVEAAVSAATAGTTRANMTKAVNDIVKADWRLVSFNREQDSTGLERWSATYEARIPENQLGGLGDKAKQTSKAGMQINVVDIDFSPTLEETQATISQLRVQIYKQVNDQLSALNNSIQGRNYRISNISFNNVGAYPSQPRAYMNKMRHTAQDMAVSSTPEIAVAGGGSMERSEKVTVTAHITYAATTPSPAK